VTAQVSVRPLAAADAQYLVDVCVLPHCRGFVYAPPVERVLAAIGSADAESYVVEADGRRVGVVRLAWFGEPLWLVELRLLAIAEPGVGYGAAALRLVQAHTFETLGAHRMFLEVAAQNTVARALYERCGFVCEGTWRDGFRDADGTYFDLAVYGMLAPEYAARDIRP
jgi:diamine N-acetyltransferase